MKVSFWSAVKADYNFVLPSGFFKPKQIEILKRAKAIVLPPSCKSFHYWFCKQVAPVFPFLDTYFHCPGKAGDLFVFQFAGVPCPPTKIFTGENDLEKRLEGGETLYPFPFILKWTKGGGGAFVYRIEKESELWDTLRKIRQYENSSPVFVIQPYIEHEPYDLRVVVIGERFLTYWRVQENHHEFRNNVGQGARIYRHLYPELEKEGVRLTRQLCFKTGINLAAIDIMFKAKDKKPLFLEINYKFGIKGIGGYASFKRFLNEEIERWFSQL